MRSKTPGGQAERVGLSGRRGQGAVLGLGMRPRLCRPASQLWRRRPREGAGEGCAWGDPGPRPAEPQEPPLDPRPPAGRPRPASPALCQLRLRLRRRRQRLGAAHPPGPGRGGGRGRLSAALDCPLPPAAAAVASRPGPSRPGPARPRSSSGDSGGSGGAGSCPQCTAPPASAPALTSPPRRLGSYITALSLTSLYSAPLSAPAALGFPPAHLSQMVLLQFLGPPRWFCHSLDRHKSHLPPSPFIFSTPSMSLSCVACPHQSTCFPHRILPRSTRLSSKLTFPHLYPSSVVPTIHFIQHFPHL